MKNLKLYEYYGPRGEHADPQERIELLQEAQGKITEAVGLIEQALKGTTHERHAQTYILVFVFLFFLELIDVLLDPHIESIP